jgi:MSHA pilin protein MshC
VRRRAGAAHSGSAGFTLVELITVIVLVGVLGAIGASRFFDNAVFESRDYADQVKSLIRYAQKLAIAQNREVFVRADGNSFAVCTQSACGAANIIVAPGGNSGSRGTRARCLVNGSYSAAWMCEGRPDNVAIAANPTVGTAGVFYFDALGRPYNSADLVGSPSTFAQTVFTFTSGANRFQITIWPETGYVQ